MKPIAFRCKKCGHVFIPIKRIRRGYDPIPNRCSKCGASGKRLQKWTARDIKILLNFYNKEPWDLKTMEMAQELDRFKESDIDIGSIINKVKERCPQKPPGAPKCWSTYDGKDHCKKKCPGTHGKEIQQSCKDRKKWDDQWGKR